MAAATRGFGLACVLGLCASPAFAQNRVVQERVIQERIRENVSPGGWFGVTINDSGMIDERGNPMFTGYPIVTSVEPGSPAERAGVQPGDVLITFNDHDMKGAELALRSWMHPGASFVVQLRRKDATREVSGVIGRRPPGFGERVTLIWSSPEGTTVTSGGGMTMPTQRVRVRIPPPLPNGLPPVLLSGFSFGGGVYPFAGAEFTALNPDLSDALGVKHHGIFVTSVAPGSPARVSGLRGGDVILTADSIRLDDPMAFVRAIRDAGDHSIRLEIIRKRKAQTVLLKW